LLKHEENETISTTSITSRGESGVAFPAHKPKNVSCVPGALVPRTASGWALQSSGDTGSRGL